MVWNWGSSTTVYAIYRWIPASFHYGNWREKGHVMWILNNQQAAWLCNAHPWKCLTWNGLHFQDWMLSLCVLITWWTEYHSNVSWVPSCICSQKTTSSLSTGKHIIWTFTRWNWTECTPAGGNRNTRKYHGAVGKWTNNRFCKKAWIYGVQEGQWADPHLPLLKWGNVLIIGYQCNWCYSCKSSLDRKRRKWCDLLYFCSCRLRIACATSMWG